MPHQRSDYKLEPKPIEGGQADVSLGIRRSDDLPIALKQRKGNDYEAKARMRREIEVQRTLAHAHIMPLLDWDSSDFSWYVMPRGARTLADLPTPLDDTTLQTVLRSVLEALNAAHAAGHPHRDVKPQNIIEVAVDGRLRWVLADWGMTRRPPGETTSRLTVTGYVIGTLGYAPPEAFRDGHAVGPAGDLYSVGQVIGWATTGQDPIPNVQPSAREPWRRFARRLTALRPDQRPASAAEALGMLQGLSVGRVDKTLVLTDALAKAASGDADAALTACLEAASH